MVRVPRGPVALIVTSALTVALSSCALSPHSIETPSTPSGPSSGQVGDSLTYTASGAVCSKGHAVEYRFDWGDSSTSSYSSYPSASHSWTSPGTYRVKVRARCSTDTAVVSEWSPEKLVTIAAAGPLQILDFELKPYNNPFMPWVIQGHARNVSNRTLSYASVTGTFYDANGVLLTSSLDNVNNLAPGVVWEFKIYCFDSDVADRVHHAEVTVGACF